MNATDPFTIYLTNKNGFLIMNKLNIELENSYGIKKLKCSLDFTDKSTYSIYAPNGIMKTSEEFI
jgi:hypothetical protein